MKKSLIAIAILGAAAFSAQAANVTLYGTVDAGFMYKNHKVTADGEQIGKKESSFKMADGVDGANKIGIKGEEDIGNAKVGFKLENQFKISNGEFKDSSKLFSREARMYVKSDFGELSAGRFGGLASAAGSYDIFFGNADAFDGGDNDLPYAFATSSRYDNSIAYQSPEIAGFQGTLMYSFQKDGKQADKMKDNDRYIGAGLTFKQDALALVGVFEAQLRPNELKEDAYKNGFTYSIGGNYDFGMAKVFAGAQYAKNTNFSDIQHGFDVKALIKEVPLKDAFAGFKQAAGELAAPQQKELKEGVNDIIHAYNKLEDENVADWDGVPGNLNETDFNKVVRGLGAYGVNHMQYDGFAFTLGSQIPFGANKVTVAGYFGQYKNSHDYLVVDKKDAKLNIYGIDGRYEYSLSKRTTLAAGAGIGQSQIKIDGDKLKDKMAQVYLGLHHNF